MEHVRFSLIFYSYKSFGIILVWASTGFFLCRHFRYFYFCLSSLDVAALYKDSHGNDKRFLSNLHYKNVTGPHSVKAKSFLVLVRSNGFVVATRN